MKVKQPATPMSAQPPSIPLFLLRLPSVLLCLDILTFGLSGAEHCYNIGNFTAAGYYAKNRELVLSSLASNMISNGGFYSGKVGKGSDVVYVLGFCRGDSSNDTCFKCISSAAKDLMIKCPTQKAAFSWGPKGNPPCIIRYSDSPMFGRKQTFPTLMLYNTGHIQMDQDQFDPIWRNFNKELAARASMGTSELKFAAGSTVLPNHQTMFALLQCSPDLSRIDCQSCLLECINDYQGCCHGYQGGVVHKPSCIFRWDLYPFFESNPRNPQSSLPPPTAVTDGWFNFEVSVDFKFKNHNYHSEVLSDTHEIAYPCCTFGSVVAVVRSAVLLVMVIVSVCCFIRRRRINPLKVSSGYRFYR